MKTLRYFKTYLGESEAKEISYDDALSVLLGTWKDSDMTRDMLSIVNRIQNRFSTIDVKEYDDEFPDHPKVLMAGLYNMLPLGVEYDDNCNRIQ